MRFPQRITLCGMGGQGIILSAMIIGTSAVTRQNLYAIQTQSYGSEARGGQCLSELIIDRKPINSPHVEKKDIMVAMFQSAYEKYICTLDPNGVLIYDPSLVTHLNGQSIKRTFAVPATQIAIKLGNRMAANMVMLGFLSEAFSLLEKDDLIKTVTEMVSPRYIGINLLAIGEGIELAKTDEELAMSKSIVYEII